MPESYRNGVFALGLVIGVGIATFVILWIFGLNYCPGEPCEHPKSASDLEDDADRPTWQMPDAIRGTFSYEREPDYAAGNPTRHEYYDLLAQERMAHATDWIAWLTLVTGLVGIVGLGSLIWTLKLQSSATKAALEANKIAVADRRAWITFSATEGEVQAIIKPENYVQIFFDLTVHNMGQTAAQVTEIRVLFADISGPHATPAIREIASGHVPSTLLADMVVFPHSDEMIGAAIGMPIVPFGPVNGGKSVRHGRIIVWAKYRSMFGQDTHSTYWTFEINPRQLNLGPIKIRDSYFKDRILT